MTKKASPPDKFEDALINLEKIVGLMESGDLSLDDSLKKYEEGIKLIRFCNKKLTDAEKKIEILVNADDDTLAKINFDDYDPKKTAPKETTKQKPEAQKETKKTKEVSEKKEKKNESKNELPPREEGMLF